jgi:hypothetical protein
MQSELTRGFQQFLDVAENAAREAPARVEAFPDPKLAGSTRYLVSGTLPAVQAASSKLLEMVDAENGAVAFGEKVGRGHMIGPMRDGSVDGRGEPDRPGMWVAIVWVYVEPSP